MLIPDLVSLILVSSLILKGLAEMALMPCNQTSLGESSLSHLLFQTLILFPLNIKFTLKGLYSKRK